MSHLNYYDATQDSTPLPQYVEAKEAKRKAITAFWRGACFGAMLAVGAFIGSAAIGQPFQEPRMSLEGPTGDCFAMVAIENRAGVYNLAETLMTAAGPVTLQYRTVGGHNATDADEVTVIALPDGVVADPERMDLPDGETGHVCLIEWVGL